MEKHTTPHSPYSLLSGCRNELMGFSILWIVWFHSSIVIPSAGVDFVKNLGYVGVDIFLLLSGMGIYRSLEHNNIRQFFRNRLKKILPIWWSFLIIGLPLGYFFFDILFTPREILGSALFTGFWLDIPYFGSWYVYSIMLLYLVSPLLAALIRESERKTATWLTLVFLLTALSFTAFHQFRLIFFSRVPIYVTGMYLAAVGNRKPMGKRSWAACLLLLGAGILLLAWIIHFLPDYLWSYGLWWYPCLILAVPLTLVLCQGITLLQAHVPPVCKCLRFFGAASLELLLTTDFAFNYASSLVPPGNRGAAVILLCGVLAGLLFHYLVEKGTSFLESRIPLCK